MDEMIASEKPVDATGVASGVAGAAPAAAGQIDANRIDANRIGADKIETGRTDVDRNSIFAHLVKDDTDISGLVAYSIYKQNKLDWLSAFEREKHRAPNDAELSSYIIGESTPRRLLTYRHLAEATLAGAGPTNGDPRSNALRRGSAVDKSPLTGTLVATYAIIAVLFVIGFWLAAHFTMANR